MMANQTTLHQRPNGVESNDRSLYTCIIGISLNVLLESTCNFLLSVGLLHGDMTQQERNEVITTFKKKELPVMVATDVAGM